jgi:transforming growth factor-beta-induced protein
MINILDAAINEGMFDKLVKAWVTVGMDDSLVNGGPYTVFAPTDRAFERMSMSALEELVRDKKRFRDLLSYHIVHGRMLARDVAAADCLPTMLGKNVCFDLKHGIKVGDARIVQTDIECTNGVIHAIDRVLMPDDVLERVSG